MGALEPCGEALRVGCGIAAQEARQAGCDGGLVSQAEHGGAQKADGPVRGRRQAAGFDPTAARVAGGRWFEEAKLVVPADRPLGGGLLDQFREVGAAAEDDVLRVDGLAERGMQVGVGAAADEGAAFQESHGCAIAGQRNGGGETSYARADHGHVGGARVGGATAQIGGALHSTMRFHAAIVAPRRRTASFSAVERAMRSPKTSILRAAMRASRR